MARVLLLLPTTSYRTPDFLKAAEKLGVAVTVASEEASTLEERNPEGLLTLDFKSPEACADRVAAFAKRYPLSAVIGVDEDTAVVASVIAARLGLPHNPVSAVEAARNKARMRELLARNGLPSPPHRLFRIGEDPGSAARGVTYPCVLKPTFLAASRGVIRADDAAAFVEAWRRIAAILQSPEIVRRDTEAAREILVEGFVPGAEVALEGLLRDGMLRVLALFDKPDPLEGPYFEETIYVTPSRLTADVQNGVAQTAGRAADALGLRDGPVHGEFRINAGGIWTVEMAARSIGGLCSRTLRFGTGISLEELILRHALGLDVTSFGREPRAAGVMMIPIPRAGVLEEVLGLEEARRIPQIEEIAISAHLGQSLVPLPEGSRYLGFLFSRAETPERAEAALREAHARLQFVISGSNAQGRNPSLRSG
ncbi:MAG TPA: ATP-grasp domain-containing protein [Thermoanaerobaculia bacterium]